MSLSYGGPVSARYQSGSDTPGSDSVAVQFELELIPEISEGRHYPGEATLLLQYPQ